MTDDAPDIAAELAYMAEHPELFTKKEMAAMLAAASVVIGDLQMLVALQETAGLGGLEPKGSA